jgi:drug/metabolite transporter (DMT)-like permease
VDWKIAHFAGSEIGFHKHLSFNQVPSSLPKRTALLPLTTSLLFAGSFIAGKYTTVDLGPLTTSLLRYMVALVFLTLLAIAKRLSLTIDLQDLGKLALLGLFGTVGYHYFFFSALRHTEVANTAIINALSPIVTGLMAALFLKERLTSRNYWGVTIAVAGALVLLTKGQTQNVLKANMNLGDGLMLLAVISWAIYALLVKRLSEKYSGFCLFFYATFLGVVMLIGLAFTENWPGHIKSISTASFWSIMYMGAVASGIGYLLYTVSIGRIGPTRTSSFVYSLVPIFVAILALLFFHEPITAVMMISVAGILLGLHLMMTERPM